MRIATWNVERPKNEHSPRSQHILAKLSEVKADIWILTETHDAIVASVGYHAISTPTVTSTPIFHQQGEHKTTIWSRWPLIEVFETSTRHRAVCTAIETPLGNLVVYGTVIPYHGARWPYGTKRNWDAHYAAIATQGADWSRLRRKYPMHGLCIAGDFNQNRPFRTNYGTKWGLALLDLALDKNNLIGVTQADFPAAKKLTVEHQELLTQSIDHICLSRRWAKWVRRVEIWPGVTADGIHLSDHSGVVIDLGRTE